MQFSPGLRFAVALLFPVAACAVQALFWDSLSPYAWFLFYPAILFA